MIIIRYYNASGMYSSISFPEYFANHLFTGSFSVLSHHTAEELHLCLNRKEGVGSTVSATPCEHFLLDCGGKRDIINSENLFNIISSAGNGRMCVFAREEQQSIAYLRLLMR